MASLLDQAERFQKINLKNAISEALFSLENELIGYNVDQLSEGRNRDGNLVGRYKKITEQYAKFDRPIRPKVEGEPYNYEWSGTFIEKMRAIIKGDDAELTSDVSYITNIEALGSRNRAQNKTFGLTKEHLKEFTRKHFLPRVLSIIKRQ